MTDVCPCTEEGYCPHYRRLVRGPDWRLSRLRNHLGRTLRALWLREAEEAARRSAPAERGACQHLGRRVRLPDGTTKTRACG